MSTLKKARFIKSFCIEHAPPTEHQLFISQGLGVGVTYEYSLEGEAVKAWLKCHKETSQLVNSTSGTVVGRGPYQCGLNKVSGRNRSFSIKTCRSPELIKKFSFFIRMLDYFPGPLSFFLLVSKTLEF